MPQSWSCPIRYFYKTALIQQVPTPDTYRGKFREDALNPGYRYAQEVKQTLQKAQDSGRNVSVLLLVICRGLT